MDDSEILEPGPDTSGPALSNDTSNWISVSQAAHLFADAGMPRNKRTIRRYCERGELECRKTENALHQPQYFIAVSSVETYIEQQRTLLAPQPDMSGFDRTGPDMSGQEISGDEPDSSVESRPDMSGFDRTGPDMPGQIVPPSSLAMIDQLETRLRDKDDEIRFLRDELLHRRTTDSALHDVIAAFRANAETQRLAAAPLDREPGTTQPLP